MSDAISLDDIEDKAKTKIYKQDYSAKTPVEGVRLINVKAHISDEGDFSELMRFDDQGELEGLPGFKIAQINRTHLFARSIKAWHVHFKQDEIWYVRPSAQLFVGLWDLRKQSPTADKTMRINIGGGQSQLLFIPKGVAHGTANFDSSALDLYYFVNRKFNINEPDEFRLPWDSIGKEFWMPEKD